MNMKKLLVLFSLVSYSLAAQVSMEYYLPTDVTYNQDLPTPEEVLGYVPGDWHVSHDQLIYFMRTLADASDRIAIENYAKSYEGRQLMQLIITSPANHQRIDKVKSSRKEVKTGQVEQTPLVVQLGYSVHGNEASGSNASLLVAYYLAAAQGPKVEQMLDEMVIVLDPSYNPDGLNRFASWVNTHKSKNISADPNNREYDEPWPRGRTNHYWFDLNRDWLPVQHPESQGRIRQFHTWMPHVLTDHHEMGTSNTFFFQPGIPSRKFPNTDNKNPYLTNEIAKFHANALDSIGSLYYSKESFDDYYIGKGSTYPDVNGSIGILFEQASTRGHAQESPYGTLTFPFAIRNQFVSSLSTLAASQSLMGELKSYQQQQFRDAANWDTPKAYVFGDERDKMKSLELVRILQTHDIKVHALGKNVDLQENSFLLGSGYVVRMTQPQARLIKSIFETRKNFTDSLFYDVSAWTLPLAMNIPVGEIAGKSLDASYVGAEIDDLHVLGQLIGGNSDYAYAFETYGYFAHRAIQRLLDAAIVLRVTHAFHLSADKSFSRGSILIPVGVQQEKSDKINQIIKKINREDGIDVYALNTGFATKGIDLGSPSMSKLQQMKVAILVDDGVSGYEAGEAWHVLDQRLDVATTLLPVDRVNATDLSRYNRIVMPSGLYNDIGKKGIERLKSWIQAGGVLVAWKNAGSWLAKNELSKVKYEAYKTDSIGYKPYADYFKNTGAQIIGGTIFEARLDLTHPLTYGISKDRMPLFRNHNQIMKKATNQYAHPLVYTSSPLLSGYVHQKHLEKISNSPAAHITAMGRGRVIIFSDNPNFRAFWYGTNKLYFNALYFGHTIISGTAR